VKKNIFPRNPQKILFHSKRKMFTIWISPEVHHAFKLLCDASGYRKMSEALEKIMIKCIESESLGIEPKGFDKMASRLAQLGLIKRRLRERGVKI